MRSPFNVDLQTFFVDLGPPSENDGGGGGGLIEWSRGISLSLTTTYPIWISRIASHCTALDCALTSWSQSKRCPLLCIMDRGSGPDGSHRRRRQGRIHPILARQWMSSIMVQSSMRRVSVVGKRARSWASSQLTLRTRAANIHCRTVRSHPSAPNPQ